MPKLPVLALAFALAAAPAFAQVTEPAVNQAIASGAARLVSLQNADGGWFYEADLTHCYVGPGVSCPNTFGVTGLGLLAAHVRAANPAAKLAIEASMNAAGAALVAQAVQAMAEDPQRPPFNQNVEFLVELGTLTGNALYTTTAHDWFQVTINRYSSAAARIDAGIASRDAQGYRSAIAWDTASVIRAAVAVGEIEYATDAAAAVVDREFLWKITDPALSPADNPFAYALTIVGEGSLLWAFHDLGGFDGKIVEYRNFLVSAQGADGAWNGGDAQTASYVMVGLAAVGGADTALSLAGAFLVDHQLASGGWPSSVSATENGTEIVEIDGEIVRAIATLFNTPAGEDVTVAPAQLSTLTFSNVRQSGRTTVVAETLPTNARVAAGFQVVDDLTYEVRTTARFRGAIVVCMNAPTVDTRADFARVRLLHLERGVLVDRTIQGGRWRPRFATRQVCAAVSSLSPFAVATHGKKFKKTKRR